MSEENKEFNCNVLLIKALLPFVPATDRKRIREWLEKFQEMEEGCSDTRTRDEYCFYLLNNVQNGTLSEPFNKSPPPGKLKSLCKILPDFKYDEIKKQLKVSMCRLNKMLNANNENYEMPELKCEPSGFQSQQPRPPKGVSALFAVFSNYEDDNK